LACDAWGLARTDSVVGHCDSAWGSAKWPRGPTDIVEIWSRPIEAGAGLEVFKNQGAGAGAPGARRTAAGWDQLLVPPHPPPPPPPPPRHQNSEGVAKVVGRAAQRDRPKNKKTSTPRRRVPANGHRDGRGRLQPRGGREMMVRPVRGRAIGRRCFRGRFCRDRYRHFGESRPLGAGAVPLCMPYRGRRVCCGRVRGVGKPDVWGRSRDDDGGGSGGGHHRRARRETRLAQAVVSGWRWPGGSGITVHNSKEPPIVGQKARDGNQVFGLARHCGVTDQAKAGSGPPRSASWDSTLSRPERRTRCYSSREPGEAVPGDGQCADHPDRSGDDGKVAGLAVMSFGRSVELFPRREPGTYRWQPMALRTSELEAVDYTQDPPAPTPAAARK